MANHAREKRVGRTHEQNSTPTLTLVPDTQTEETQCSKNPTLSDPASWTPEFCFQMAKSARNTESSPPVSPHEWSRRGHTIAFQIERKGKHPYKGMPIDSDGREVVKPAHIAEDWKIQLLGAVDALSEKIPHAG